MFITLRGKVTIYIQYAKPAAQTEPKNDDAKENGEKDGATTSAPAAAEVPEGVNIREQLGTFVTHLGPGATFGEVALLKEDDCVRTASIIASDDEVDLIEINRDLYNRCAQHVHVL